MNITVEMIEEQWPDCDAEWLYEDYRSYWRHFEDRADRGEVAPAERMLSFWDWLNGESHDYRAAHGV